MADISLLAPDTKQDDLGEPLVAGGRSASSGQQGTEAMLYNMSLFIVQYGHGEDIRQ